MSQAVELPTPFGESVDEIHLPAAPLIAVIAQVRFPPIASIVREDFIGTFQELIRSSYPVLRKDQEVNIVLTPDGVTSGGEPSTVWRFLDQPSDPGWKVSLAPSFIALDTSRYESRSDFIDRLQILLAAVADTINPSTYDRLGVRYVDRIELHRTGAGLAELVRPEVLGMVTVDPGEGAGLLHGISDTQYQLEDATFRGRWGQVPPGTQMDPSHGNPVDSPSWILDLDMYETRAGPFDVDRLASTAESFAERIYRFFRWAVRPALLRRYGGLT